MIGRDREREELHRALDELASGGPVPAILVEGMAGIGKSFLLGDAATHAPVPVRRAAASELEASLPFGVVAELLGRPVPPGAVRGGDDAASTEAHFGLVGSLVDALVAAAGDRPMVLIVDDVQWCDLGTTTVLDRLVRHRDPLGVGLIVAARPGWGSSPLARSIRDGGRILELAELSAAESAALVCDRLGVTRLGRVLADLTDAAEGHPRSLVEMTEHLRAIDAITIRGGRADASGDRFPGLAAALLARRPAMGGAEREVLRAVVALGSGCTLVDVVDLLARPVGEVATVVEGLLAGGYLRHTHAGLRFRHDLLRRALLDALPAGAVEELHREAAWRLHANGADPLRVAAHLRRGARPGERKAIEVLLAVAEAVISKDPSEAVTLLERAFDLETDAEQRDAIEVRSLWPLIWSGRAGDAAARATRLLRRHREPAAAVEVRIAAAAATHVLGRREDVLRYTEVDDTVLDAPPDRLLQLRAEGAEALVLRDLHEGEAGAVALAREAEATANWPAATLAWGAAAQARAFRGWFPEAVGHAEQAVRCGDQTIDARRRNKRHLLGVFLHHCDRSTEGEAVLEEGLAENDRLGIVWSTATHHLFLGGLCFDTGHLDDADAHLEAAVAVAEDTDERLNRTDVRLLQATFASHRGDFETAERLLEAHEGPPSTPLVLATARLTHLDAVGDDEALREELVRFAPPPGSIGWARAAGPPVVRMLLRCGLEDRAAAIVAVLETVSERARTPSAAASLLRARGMVTADAEAVLAAIELLRTTSRIGEIGDACEEAASLLPARDPRGVALLHEAHAAGVAAGREVAVRRRAERLRRLGVAPRTPAPDPSSAGWASLTPAERRVVDLVADGLTYRAVADHLHLSRRTVESHVAHVFQKLGVRSREQLSQLVARRRG